MFLFDVLVHELAQQHVQEDYIGRIDERDLLPALHEQRAVGVAQPGDCARRLEVAQTRAP